jgi:hypothetical protein
VYEGLAPTDEIASLFGLQEWRNQGLPSTGGGAEVGKASATLFESLRKSRLSMLMIIATLPHPLPRPLRRRLHLLNHSPIQATCISLPSRRQNLSFVDLASQNGIHTINICQYVSHCSFLLQPVQRGWLPPLTQLFQPNRR